jgi:hypothetical protein
MVQMDIQDKALSAKTASGTAEGSALGKSVPRIGEAPSKTNEQQPVPASKEFGVKGLAFKKCTSGY